MRSSFTHTPTSGRLITSSMKLPISSEAISVHTSGPSVVSSVGPGWMP
jgi:hypothetical protein